MKCRRPRPRAPRAARPHPLGPPQADRDDRSTAHGGQLRRTPHTVAGHGTAELVDALLSTIEALDRSEHGERIDKLVGLMRGPAGSTVKLMIRRPGLAEPLTFTLQREEIHVTSVVGKRLANDVAYLRLKQFQEGTHDELLRVAAKLRGEEREQALVLWKRKGKRAFEAEGSKI